MLGIDIAHDPQAVQDRVGYMPQKFGLYEDLTVQENLDLYADLHGVSAAERREVYPQLMEMTALGPFTNRLAGRLSGGMKQKLGLACTLVRAPDLLLLDEPTVGVDPLSRRELWEIILHLVHDRGLTVLISTSYLDEAERCKHVVVMHEGTVLAQGDPQSVTRMAAGPHLHRDAAGQGSRRACCRRTSSTTRPSSTPCRRPAASVSSGPKTRHARRTCAEAGARRASKTASWCCSGRRPEAIRRRPLSLGSVAAGAGRRQPAVEVSDLVRMFGSFTAVDHISFAVRRGEIFGLLGPNGAGKTTTFRMLCGLLPATAGTLRVAGVDLRSARASARQRIGYVAQKFSLYGQLSVTQNLDFFAGAYGLAGRRKARAHRTGRWSSSSWSAARPPAERATARRLQAAPGDGRRPYTRAGDPVPRRADQRRRSAGPARVLAAHHGAGRAGRDGHRHHPLHGGGRILRPGGHPRRGPGARARHAGRNPRPRPRATRIARPTMEDAFIAIVEEARRQHGRPGEKDAA